ncbi:unnamed protein product [Linum trigynum]|uniref:Uncharacterized protein n=1 Tax=Linum trigynum TaxID=586398 RepID=A0AAV2DY07_9ROSI
MFSATLLPISSMEALIRSPIASIAPIKSFEGSAALTVTSVRLSNDAAIASYLLIVTSLTVTTSLFWRGGCYLSVGFDIVRVQCFFRESAHQPGSDTIERARI